MAHVICYIKAMFIILNSYSIVGNEQTDCNKILILDWNGVGGGSYKVLQKHIGVYRQVALPKHNDYPIYENFGNHSVTSYLYYRQGFGWRINDRVTEDSKDIPAIILRKCLQECPEKCTNNGRWTYRNSKNLPVFDGRRQLNWKTEENGGSLENTTPPGRQISIHSHTSTSSNTHLDGVDDKDFITRSYHEDVNMKPGTVIQIVNKSNIGLPSLIMFSVVGFITIFGLIGFIWIYRTLKKRTSGSNEYQSPSATIYVAESKEYNPTSNLKQSCQGLEEGSKQTAIPLKDNGKRQRSISMQDKHERYKCFKQSYSFPSPGLQRSNGNYIAASSKDNTTNISGRKRSSSGHYCKHSVTCLSNCEHDTSLYFMNENAPHAHSPSTKYGDGVSTENNNELVSDNRSNYMPNDVCTIANNNEKVKFLKNPKSNDNHILKIQNSSDDSGTSGRKRLISLQTSFEEEPSESSSCSSCECVVTEVTKLGNGKIKKTIYRYNIERPSAKERLYSI